MTNIVLIVADALSAFHLPCYGYDRDTAPFLTELAEDNTFYRYAYANAPWTLPSHASLFTGDLPSEHGCTTENIYFEADSVVEDLQEEYTTVGFSNNPLLASQGFDRGFDEFAGGKVIPLAYHGYDAFETVLRREQDGQYDGKQEKYTDFLQEVVRQRDLGSLAAAARFLYRTKLRGDDRFSFLTDSGAAATNHLVQEELEDVDGDFFLFINYMEPHEPYSPPDDLKGRWVDQVGGAEQWYREQGFLAKPDNIDTSIPADMQDAIRGFYDAEVHHLDRKIRELHEYITGEFDDTVFIITADHGENLNHNDLFGHHYGAWERLLRVPLIVAGEHIPDRTIDEPVPLQNIPGLLRGETGPAGLGAGTVEAEYYGADRFFLGDESELDGYSARARAVLTNRAQARIEGRTGAVAHTELDSQAFTAQPDRPGDDIPVEEVAFFSQLAVERIVDDIDI